MNSIKICKLTLKDAMQMASLHAVSFPRGWKVSEFQSFLRSPAHFAVGAFAGRKAVGFILCRRAAEECEIITFAVQPERRREGLGSALLEQAMEHAAESGAEEMFLEVELGNEAAIKLYEKHAFAAVGARKGYYPGNNGENAKDALVMRRNLA